MLLFILVNYISSSLFFLHAVYTGDREVKSKTMCLKQSRGDSKGEATKSCQCHRAVYTQPYGLWVAACRTDLMLLNSQVSSHDDLFCWNSRF